MSWKKGAVVIIKHGDEDFADAIEDGLNIQKITPGEVEELKQEIEKLKKENKELRRANEMMKIHDTRFTNEAIDNLTDKYKNNYRTPPKWAKIIMDGVAVIIYWISMFIDKYLVIK